MSLEPIIVELSPYNKLQILRKQLDERSRELQEIEVSIREILTHVQEVEFLKSLASAYSHLDASEELQQLGIMEGRRAELNDLITVIEKMIPDLEKDAKNGVTSPSAAPKLERNQIGGNSAPSTPTEAKPLSSSKPLSFDEFRKKFPSSGV